MLNEARSTRLGLGPVPMYSERRRSPRVQGVVAILDVVLDIGESSQAFCTLVNHGLLSLDLRCMTVPVDCQAILISVVEGLVFLGQQILVDVALADSMDYGIRAFRGGRVCEHECSASFQNCKHVLLVGKKRAKELHEGLGVESSVCW